MPRSSEVTSGKKVKAASRSTDWLKDVGVEFNKTWRKTEYDGIRGHLPEWMPKADKETFDLCCFRVFIFAKKKGIKFPQIKKLFLWQVRDSVALRKSLDRPRGSPLSSVLKLRSGRQ